MSIPPDSRWRGCAAAFPQPVDKEAKDRARNLVMGVHFFNCYIANPPLEEIIYRSSSREEDVLRHVYRWDLTPYGQVFDHGFQARPQGDTPDEDYYNLERYVRDGGRPLDTTRSVTYGFVSTTLNCDWHPSLEANEDAIEVCRYEIFAPGGIWVAQTLGDRYLYPSQDEVCFVAGIAPQYIRSAQLFRLERSGSHTRRQRVDDRIIVNGNYNPQSHPSRLLNIRRPVHDRMDDARRRVALSMTIYKPQLPLRDKREVRINVEDDVVKWYACTVTEVKNSINAAFRASASDEAYLFMKNEYVLVNYAPGSTNDRVINGPLLICDGYPSLAGTAFGEQGIDCAFGSHTRNQAYIFSGNLCAHIDYAPGTTNDRILRGPMTIAHMFPFFKRTVFESGIDAAFEATASGEAYLFKGDQYALINYQTPSNIAIRRIRDGFASLKGTIFESESGIDAAFASHRTNEAYLFKGDQYALIDFAPGTTNDYIIGGIKPILPNWPSLQSVLARDNKGLDVHYHHEH